MSYGTSYHNGADCEWCGARIMWDNLKLHREWHMSLKTKMMKLAILDLAELAYMQHSEIGEAVISELKRTLGLSNSEGVDSA